MGRRVVTSGLLLLAALYVPPCKLRASEEAAAPPATVLVVGRPVPFRPDALPASVICDDSSVVRVEDAGDHLVVTGLEPGTTECSFGAPSRAGRRQLQRFEVRAAP